MKQFLLSSVFLMGSFCASLAQEHPTAQWGNLFGGTMTSGDQSIAVAASNDGKALWLNTANTDASAPTVFYAGEEIFSNETKINNLSLLCTESDGSMKWQAYSTTLDAASSQGGVAVDADGNVIIAAKVRQTAGATMALIGADDQATAFGEIVEKPFYQIMVAKLDSDGIVEWVKLFKQSTAPAPAAADNNADFTSDAVSVSAVAVDDLGNIYVGGYYRSEMTIDDVTLQPQNVIGWTGDSQATCGNMFIVKLDADGHYAASAVGQGEINGASAIQALQWNDGKLYLYGYAKGDAAFTFAGKELTCTDVNSPIVGRLNADLSADWLSCLPGETVDGKSALQNVGLSICNDNLWLAGMFNQKILSAAGSDVMVAATQGSLREGFIIKLDKNSGLWLASADSRADFPAITKLTGYLKVVQNPADVNTAYVYGYVMDANIGVFLREYNTNTLVPNLDNAWNIATGGGVPSAVASAYDSADNTLYITARGNKAFTLMGAAEITTPATNAWDVLMAKFTLPKGNTSSVSAIATSADDAIYDITGRKAGDKIEGLAPGIYISNNKKFIVR